MSSKTKALKSFTMNELRVVLSEEIVKLRDGHTSASNVNAISNASGKLLSTLKLELEVAKLLGKTPALAGVLTENTQAAAK